MLGMTVKNGQKHHAHGTTNCGFRPPKTSRMQATSHIPGLNNQPSSAVGATVLRGLRDSQSENLLAMHISTFTPSTSSATTPFRWTCDRAWDRKEHGTTSRQRHPRSLWVLPDGAARCKQNQACDRLLVFVALACPQLPALGGQLWEMCLDRTSWKVLAGRLVRRAEPRST